MKVRIEKTVDGSRWQLLPSIGIGHVYYCMNGRYYIYLTFLCFSLGFWFGKYHLYEPKE